MSRLLIKFATRNRPEKFKDRMNRFRDLASGKHEIRYVVSCDHDDPTMNNEDMISWMDEFSKDSDLVYHFGNSKSKIEAINTDMEGEVFDVLLNTSDDMVPMKQDFDDVIFQVYSQAYPDFSGAVKFHDGLRNDQLMTYTVIGRPLYEAFGYIYHPEYTSVFSDNEQTQACARIGKLVVCDVCILKHDWTAEHFDELHARNETGEMYQKDGAVFNRRAELNFEIDKLKEKLNAQGFVTN